MPSGRLYVAMFNDSLAGCVALREINKELCEMKRLYVRKQYRNFGIGRALVEKIINDAGNIGYGKILLDTLPSMRDAISLYKKLGFAETQPYCNNPNGDFVYLELNLCS